MAIYLLIMGRASFLIRLAKFNDRITIISPTKTGHSLDSELYHLWLALSSILSNKQILVGSQFEVETSAGPWAIIK